MRLLSVRYNRHKKHQWSIGISIWASAALVVFRRRLSIDINIWNIQIQLNHSGDNIRPYLVCGSGYKGTVTEFLSLIPNFAIILSIYCVWLTFRSPLKRSLLIFIPINLLGDKSLLQLRTAVHHHPPNQERAINLPILLVSGPGKVSRVASN